VKREPILTPRNEPEARGTLSVAPRASIDRLHPFVHVIHQHVLPNIVRCREVRFPVRHLGHFLHERDQIRISSQHERIEAPGVLVNPSIGQGQRARFAIGDHDDLFHVFVFAFQELLREPQSARRVRVVRPDLRLSQPREWDFFCTVMKQHEFDRVARELRANHVCQRQRHLLGGREAVLAVQDHAVRAVQHHDGRGGGLVLGLTHHQVAFLDILEALGDHVGQRLRHVQV
jgi:hypothetical protein